MMPGILLQTTFIAACVAAFVLLGERRDHRHARGAVSRIRESQQARGPVAVAETYDTATDVAGRVRRVVATVAMWSIGPGASGVVDADRIDPADRLVGDLAFELDSLAYLEMGLALEREFGIKFKRNDLDGVRTVADVVRVVTRCVGSR
jgi:acyl carrier protein